jgi:hypothetical protein
MLDATTEGSGVCSGKALVKLESKLETAPVGTTVSFVALEMMLWPMLDTSPVATGF